MPDILFYVDSTHVFIEGTGIVIMLVAFPSKMIQTVFFTVLAKEREYLFSDSVFLIFLQDIKGLDM